MTEQTRGAAAADLERALRALAEVDCHVSVPPHVHLAVMQAWDAQAPDLRPSRERRRAWRAALFTTITVASACAAVIAVYPRSPEMRPRERSRTADAGIVLVADPLFDASVTSIVRVRVPRRALVSLGIPVIEPDGGGLVDLEILVGEDGVARTIRRAVPVAASAP